MAVDQALLETANQTGQLTVRFYSWEQPTVSLGYFQKYQQRWDHEGSVHCPIVRRSTGGGAIVHDQEITYSLCIPSQNRWAKDNEGLYWMMHRLLVSILSENSIDATLFNGVLSEYDDQAFLCFRRRTAGDVTLDGYKIVGSAQRRKQHAILQHGSVLLDRSDCAEELPGIKDLARQSVIDSIYDFRDSILNQWVARLPELFGDSLQEGQLTEVEREVAKRYETVHQSEAWLKKR